MVHLLGGGINWGVIVMTAWGRGVSGWWIFWRLLLFASCLHSTPPDPLTRANLISEISGWMNIMNISPLREHSHSLCSHICTTIFHNPSRIDCNFFGFRLHITSSLQSGNKQKILCFHIYSTHTLSHESKFLGTPGGISTSTIFASGLQHLGKWYKCFRVSISG